MKVIRYKQQNPHNHLWIKNIEDPKQKATKIFDITSVNAQMITIPIYIFIKGITAYRYPPLLGIKF